MAAGNLYPQPCRVNPQIDSLSTATFADSSERGCVAGDTGRLHDRGMVDLAHTRLLEVLSFDPETGKFHRACRTSNAIRIGQEAGWVNTNGYRYIEVCGQRFLAQRLAWFYMTGEWPSAEIDHRDCDRDNNRWANLRQATRVLNAHNSRLKAANTTGFKGVSRNKRNGRFAARIRHAGKKLSLGEFGSAEEAHQAYVQKATELYGEFARAS